MPEPCPECNGTGELVIDHRDVLDNIVDTFAAGCPRCDGDGDLDPDDGPDCG